MQGQTSGDDGRSQGMVAPACDDQRPGPDGAWRNDTGSAARRTRPPATGDPKDFPMAVFAIRYEYASAAADRDRHRPAHLDFIEHLADSGVLLMSGPLSEHEPPGGLIVLQASTKEQALAILARDPFQTESLVSRVSALHWLPRYGRLAKEL